MDTSERLKKYDNLHIIFWLVKDSCWMLELRWLGALVMIPTIYLAIHIIFKTLRSKDVFINIAIFFWISANSFWMMMEFFNDDLYKNYSLIPFSLGFVFVGIYYYRQFFSAKKTE